MSNPSPRVFGTSEHAEGHHFEIPSKQSGRDDNLILGGGESFTLPWPGTFNIAGL